MYRNVRSSYTQNAIFNIKVYFLLYYRLTILVTAKCLRMFVPVPVGGEYSCDGVVGGDGGVKSHFWLFTTSLSCWLRFSGWVRDVRDSLISWSQWRRRAHTRPRSSPPHSLYWHERGRLISSHLITSHRRHCVVPQGVHPGTTEHVHLSALSKLWCRPTQRGSG